MADCILAFAENGPKLTKGLEEFCNQVMQGKAKELIDLYTIDELINAFIQALNHASGEQFIQIAYSLLVFMDACPDVTENLAKSPILSKFFSKGFILPQLYEHLLNIISRFVNFTAISLESSNIETFLFLLPKYTEQHIIPSVQVLSSLIEPMECVSCTNSLIILNDSLAKFHDTTQESIYFILTLVMSKHNPVEIPVKILINLLNLLSTTKYQPTCFYLLQATHIAMNNKLSFNEINESLYPFYNIPLMDNFKGNTDILNLSMQICVDLLPKTEFPKEFSKHSLSCGVNNNKFLSQGYEGIESVFYMYPENIMATAAYAGTIRSKKPKPSPKLYEAMQKSCKIPQNIPCNLLIASNLDDLTPLAQNRVLAKFQNSQFGGHQWFRKTWQKLQKRCPAMESPTNLLKYGDIFEMLEIIGSDTIPYEQLVDGAFKRLIDLLKEHGTVMDLNIEPTIKVALDILNNIQFESEPARWRNEDIWSFQNCKIPVRCRDLRLTVSLTTSMAYIEGSFNMKFNPRCVDDLRAAIKKHPYLEKIVLSEECDIMEPARFAVLSRIFENPSYKACYFRFNGFNFNIDDSLSTVIATKNPRLVDVDRQNIVFEAVEGDCPRTNFQIPPVNLSETIIEVLDFLKLVHDMCPVIKLTESDFARNTIKKINSPLEAVLRKSTAILFVYSYPFLFTFKEKLFTARTVLATPNDTLEAFAETFHIQNYRPNVTRHKVLVNRENIYETGTLALKIAARSAISIGFLFENEPGFGRGPTREFFQLMSRELMKNKRKMWMSSDYSTEYATMPNGLFPRPDSNSEDFFTLGVLASKALQENLLLDFEISPAFVKMIFGKEITLADVDETLAKSLEQPEGLIGLDFTYPGLPEIKLSDKYDEVTKENLAEYVELIKKFTIEYIGEQISQFRLGFSRNAELLSAMLFEPDEFSRALCGDKALFTAKDLQQFLIADHGYTKKSTEIKRLISMVSNFSPQEQRLFCRFITGSERLPPGGLPALHPAITVVRREGGDEAFPSVSTCSNYLKMPKYSCEQIMKERFLTAMMYGHTFAFS